MGCAAWVPGAHGSAAGSRSRRRGTCPPERVRIPLVRRLVGRQGRRPALSADIVWSRTVCSRSGGSRGGELSLLSPPVRRARGLPGLASGVELAVGAVLCRAAREVYRRQGRQLKPVGGHRARAPAGPSGSPLAEIAAPERPGEKKKESCAPGPRYAAATTATAPIVDQRGPRGAFVVHRRASRLGHPRRPRPRSPRPRPGSVGGLPGTPFRLFEGSAARGNGSAAVPPSSRAPRDPSDADRFLDSAWALDLDPEVYAVDDAPTSVRHALTARRSRAAWTTDPLLGHHCCTLQAAFPGFRPGDGADAAQLTGLTGGPRLLRVRCRIRSLVPVRPTLLVTRCRPTRSVSRGHVDRASGSRGRRVR